MHIQPVKRTFTVTLTSDEIRLIAFGLGLHAVNEGTVPSKVNVCNLLKTKFENAIKHPEKKGE